MRFNKNTLLYLLSCTLFLIYGIYKENLKLYLLLSFIFFIIIYPIVKRTRGEKIDIFEPIYVLLFLYLFHFIIRAIYLDHFPEEAYPQYYGLRPIFSLELLNKSLLYLSIGLLSMIAGYYSTLPRIIVSKIKKVGLIFNGRPKISFVVAIFILGLLGQLLLFLLGYGTAVTGRTDIPNYLGIIQKLAFLLSISIILSYSIYLKSKKKSNLIMIILMVIIYLIIFFIKGWRAFLLNSIWLFILPYHYLYKRINKEKLSMGLIILLLITIIAIIPLFSNYRIMLIRTNFSIYDALKKSFEEYYIDINPSIKFLLNRMIGLDSFMLIIDKNEKLNGYTLYYSAIGLIPRFIWGNKPNLDVGRKTAVDIYNIPYDIETSMSVMNIGDLYWNFGIWGSIIGMAILGVLYRFLYLYFISKPTIGSITTYTSLFIVFTNIEDGIGMLTTNMISLLILILIIFILNEVTNKGILDR